MKPTCTNLMETPKPKTSLEVYEEESRLGYLCTFIDSLDNISKDSNPLRHITEFCGESMVLVKLNYEIAEGVINLYNSLKIKYTSKIQTFEELNVKTILEKISYISVQDHIELFAVVAHVKQWLRSQSLVKVRVIDSICVPL
ncbi:hypothetical protein FQR65_LT13365 [Abscondita terminalis]|nr:hypothetical protein FQR65_LT13365 [Abscondita terminalis]